MEELSYTEGEYVVEMGDVADALYFARTACFTRGHGPVDCTPGFCERALPLNPFSPRAWQVKEGELVCHTVRSRSRAPSHAMRRPRPHLMSVLGHPRG